MAPNMPGLDGSATAEHIAMNERYGASNYAPLPVVLSRAEGVYLFDVEGRRYFDMLSAYSAVNQGHQHPKIVQAMLDQVQRLALTSRAFFNDQLGPFLKLLCETTGFAQALPMNSGAEAVETAIKLARRWAYRVKAVAADKAEVIVCSENFHGRTTTIVGFSSDPDSFTDFGPATPGFVSVPYGDAAAIADAITPNTAAVLVEPIQGEAGVIIPPHGYLRAIRELCTLHKILFIDDEIQTGLGRTGTMFRFEVEDAKPDVLILGKALSGGLYPVSAVLSEAAIMKVFTPGSHGSTFGGNPLAAAIAKAALQVLIDEDLPSRAAERGRQFLDLLSPLRSDPKVKQLRGAGLLMAIEFQKPIAKKVVKELANAGVLAKDTHGTTIRFAPPLVISEDQVKEVAGIILSTIRQSLRIHG